MTMLTGWSIRESNAGRIERNFTSTGTSIPDPEPAVQGMPRIVAGGRAAGGMNLIIHLQMGHRVPLDKPLESLSRVGGWLAPYQSSLHNSSNVVSAAPFKKMCHVLLEISNDSSYLGKQLGLSTAVVRMLSLFMFAPRRRWQQTPT